MNKFNADEQKGKGIFYAKNKLGMSDNLTLDPDKIIQSGKSIKNIVYLILTIIASIVIGYAIALDSKDVESMKKIFWVVVFTTLICNVIIVICLFEVGKNLENAFVPQIYNSNNPLSTSLKKLKDGSSIEVYNFDGWLNNKKVTINGNLPLDGDYTLASGEIISTVNGIIIYINYDYLKLQ